MKPDAVELRVLGALLEKQRTTPDVYPLTLNALRAACNQTTNRDPVVDLDDAQIRHALEELGRRRWTRSAGGSRAAKYRHLLNDTLGVAPPEQAVLAVLLLRGPQTPGELRTRTERLHRFADGAELEATIDGLAGRGLVARVERRPGQKEGRIVQLLGDAGPQETPLDDGPDRDADAAPRAYMDASHTNGAAGVAPAGA
ncbi:YceH family protein, partial [Patulibacter sp. S7RM1-6]